MDPLHTVTSYDDIITTPSADHVKTIIIPPVGHTDHIISSQEDEEGSDVVG